MRRVLLYEHFSSGGLAGQPIPAGLLCEEIAMLESLTTDFRTAHCLVTVLRDSLLARSCPVSDADRVTNVRSPEEAAAAFRVELKSVDAAYVVAPESDGTLQLLVEQVKRAGVVCLNSEPEAIRLVADKSRLQDLSSKLGVKFPTTFTVSSPEVVSSAKRTCKRIGFPVVFKPVCGAGGEKVSLVASEEQVALAIKKIGGLRGILIQGLVTGVPVSVSLITTGAEALPLSLNRQDITLSSPNGCSSYNGGLVPFDHELKEEAFCVAKRLVESFSGLRGYVGVDLILTEKGVVVMELNPRLTTSYVGLRKVATYNVSEAIMDAAVGKLPSDTGTAGYAFFRKVPRSDGECSLAVSVGRTAQIATTQLANLSTGEQ